METETSKATKALAADLGQPVGRAGLAARRAARTKSAVRGPAMVTRPCPHCEVRTVTHRAGAVESSEVLCPSCLRDLRRPDRTDTLCDCRLPDCGQCTELADKGSARMPRYPR